MENNEYPKNLVIFDAFTKCKDVLSSHNNTMVSISGGADSDIMLDLIEREREREVHYVFFDTGIEYEATKRHLDDIEKKYNIKIERLRAEVPVPLGCKTYGLPFISKFVSQMLERLQAHNFDFANDGWKSYEELMHKYTNCKCALVWWCNQYPAMEGRVSNFNINSIKYLKEFLIDNPPTFKISDKCCQGAKKNTSKHYFRQNKSDLSCLGLRKSEGGIRTLVHNSCFGYDKRKKIDVYRPIFWFTDADKEEYCKFYGVEHSDCYTKYGMKRTGCCGCPFNSRFEDDLAIVKEQEPLLYKACNNIFGQSYEYTRQFRAYKEQKKLEEKAKKSKKSGQISIEDL